MQRMDNYGISAVPVISESSESLETLGLVDSADICKRAVQLLGEPNEVTTITQFFDVVTMYHRWIDRFHSFL
jgi:hypothetical protein